MEKIKTSSISGSFYPAQKEDLAQLINSFKKDNSPDITSRAVIVPHAGLVYSGKPAYKGILALDKSIKNLFIIAPAHRLYFKGLALTSYDRWSTPFGDIEINQKINSELSKKYSLSVNDEALKDEHSIEIELPLIQDIFKEVKIVPILVGDCGYELISEIIDDYYKDKKNGFIISSDLSHFLSDAQAKKVDEYSAELIEEGNYKALQGENACGYKGIQGLAEFVEKHDYSLIRLDMINSSVVSFDKSRVVGYGTWALFEGGKNQYLKEKFGDFLINLAKKAIKANLEKSQINTDKIHHAIYFKNQKDEIEDITQYPAVLNQKGACFVTLEKKDTLRGCIGSIIAYRSLIEDLLNHANNAAFHDPRFNPLEKSEFDEIKIAISLLSAPKEIPFSSQEELLNKITPFKDGIIIKDGNYQAVYLPSVWEQINDKEAFLASLKIKAGLKPDHFSQNFKAYKFESEYISEK